MSLKRDEIQEIIERVDVLACESEPPYKSPWEECVVLSLQQLRQIVEVALEDYEDGEINNE